MKENLLPRVEWDFDNVPDTELVACCWWEYARESKSIRDCCVLRFEELTPAERERRRRFVELIWSYPHTFLAACIMVGQHGFVSEGDPRTASFPNSWQSLSIGERARRSYPVQLEHVRGPINRAGCSDTISLGEKAAQTHRKWCRQPRKIILTTSPPPVSIFYFGMEVAGFEILWEYYDNAKIKAAFAEWVDRNRPKTIPEPSDGSGHKPVDWRKKLRDLGIMRLMNFSTVAGMRTRCREAEKRFEGWESKHWSAARKRALKNFRSLLPFLPEDELPLHAATRGGRAKL